MDTIQVDGWLGRLGQGLAPRQLEATLWACADKTAKEIARCMGCSPATVVKTLDRARSSLSEKDRQIASTRGLCLEAMRRGIIAPLVLALLVGGEHNPQVRPIRRPEAPRSQVVVRAQRMEEAQLAA
ncbi:helix-turn-helix transcriptional regulator [Stutzerimonas frequens]|uniref:Helix-turn-helix transcriptional regulator n=1 Tax=Stutzerimonas frequens TaxID=2968969 RepID=A0AA47DZI0_9GAMM|nr:helix-turn-helix transcriptional regulator [Stutzerimonas frequens]WAE51202.1 helix-turn-helix transcriptional regulator [Stutzerimonas frequens]